MAFTAKDVQDLRQRTGAGMMDCKKALVATDGDIEKAMEWLREKVSPPPQRKRAGSLRRAWSILISTWAEKSAYWSK